MWSLLCLNYKENNISSRFFLFLVQQIFSKTNNKKKVFSFCFWYNKYFQKLIKKKKTVHDQEGQSIDDGVFHFSDSPWNNFGF